MSPCALLQEAGSLEQLRGQNELLKRQLAAIRSDGNTDRECTNSEAGGKESPCVEELQDEVVSIPPIVETCIVDSVEALISFAWSRFGVGRPWQPWRAKLPCFDRLTHR